MIKSAPFEPDGHSSKKCRYLIVFQILHPLVEINPDNSKIAPDNSYFLLSSNLTHYTAIAHHGKMSG